MIIVIDALNRHQFQPMLDEMHRLRQRSFRSTSQEQTGTHTHAATDEFDQLNPAHILHLDPSGRVTGGLRLLQTTGPHMLSDALSSVLQGDAPLRSARLWEASQFCIDFDTPDARRIANKVLVGALEYARKAGVLDIIALLDPRLDRILTATGDLPMDYLGLTGRGIVAALIDCSAERINNLRDSAGLAGDLIVTTEAALQHFKQQYPTAPTLPDGRAALRSYCEEQIADAQTPLDRAAAEALRLELSYMIDDVPVRRCKA